ncbi:hypothetical protein LI063_13305 [Clostridium perfringens]|uniref:hypothetical protein n=1 Tax=Clostridium perfringens TaxID=1502 RepID=UPI002245E2C2|nr:hypothetical protein [Clostridium perfringens]MCX0365128.1 hypothetical protein [Clostridium perfringens]
MSKFFKTTKKYNNLVDLNYLYCIFKKRYFENMFSENDNKAFYDDWDKVGRDLKWAIKKNNVN